jgi:hypothetical protein
MWLQSALCLRIVANSFLKVATYYEIASSPFQKKERDEHPVQREDAVFVWIFSPRA